MLFRLGSVLVSSGAHSAPGLPAQAWSIAPAAVQIHDRWLTA